MFYYIFDYRQTESNAFLIYILRSSKFTKAVKKFVNVFCCNTTSCIPYLYSQHRRFFAVTRKDLNRTFLRELQSILNQIDQHLLEPSFVAH